MDNLTRMIIEARKSGLSDKVLRSVTKKGEEILNTKTRGRKSYSTIAKHEKIQNTLSKVNDVLKSRHTERMAELESKQHENNLDLNKHFKTVAHEALEHHGFHKIGDEHPISGQTYIKHDNETGLTHMIKLEAKEPKKGEYAFHAGSLKMLNSSGMSRSHYLGRTNPNGFDHEKHKDEITKGVANYVGYHKGDEAEEKNRQSY